MNSLSIIGATIVTLALVSYSVAIISEQIRKRIIPRVLVFISLAVLLDITATAFMILGSRNSPFTFHGFVGYSALLVMLVEFFRLWGLYRKQGLRAPVARGLHLYSRFAYVWWVAAYITGSVIAMS